jgi:hypothetical protein
VITVSASAEVSAAGSSVQQSRHCDGEQFGGAYNQDAYMHLIVDSIERELE